MKKTLRSHGAALLLLAVCAFTLPIAANAKVFWNETFEGNLTPNWDVSSCGDPASFPQGCNPAISTDFAVDGTHSLKGVYDHVGNGHWMDRRYPATDEIYYRYYERFSKDWVWDDTHQVKGFNLGDSVHYPNFWIGHWGGDSESVAAAQVPAEACGSGDAMPHGDGQPYDSCQYVNNISSAPEANGQWYCIEGHIKLNTPGVADGIIERWVNGKQVAHYTGRMFRGASPSGPNGNSSLATFNFIRIYVQGQAATGSKYYDDVAVGDTRIGCGTTPPPSSAPAAPTGLTVQ